MQQNEIRNEKQFLEDLQEKLEIEEPLSPSNITDLGKLPAATTAGFLEGLPGAERDYLIESLGDQFPTEVLPYLDQSVLQDVLQTLDAGQIASSVGSLASDDAVEVLEELNPEDLEQVLELLAPEDRSWIEGNLSYPEESAGRLMRREVLALPGYWTVQRTLAYLRSKSDLPRDLYNIFVVAPTMVPLKAVSTLGLTRLPKQQKLRNIMGFPVTSVRTEDDASVVEEKFKKDRLSELAVVNNMGQLVGSITVNDAVDVISESYEKDLLYLGGVQRNDLFASVWQTTRQRLPWLSINMGTAAISSIIIYFFAADIQKQVALAILMPLVASLGGNAGTQTLTVVIRALATHDFHKLQLSNFLRKEAIVGLLDGSFLALIVAVLSYMWFQDPSIALTVGIALLGIILFGTFLGSVVPLLLHRFKIDPAVASSVILTAITDSSSFALFLGLGTLLITFFL